MYELQLRVQQWIESNFFSRLIISVILFNALILGVQTVKGLDTSTVQWLDTLDAACLAVFVVEILLKLFVYRGHFFKNGWNNFDFVIVAIALIPASGELAILRALRILRLLRLISVVPSMRRVITAMLMAIPGVTSIAGLLVIFFYIGAVMSTNLYGEAFPEWFGSLSASTYTLFQVMTLESWSMGIVRPVMEVYPNAWLFFIPFILVTTFTVLNLFIGIILDAMNSVKDEERKEAESHAPQTPESRQLDEIQDELRQVKSQLAQLLEKTPKA
jgi:voltage-gated sodium channel